MRLTDANPDTQLPEVWAVFTTDEAMQLFQSLQMYFEEEAAGNADPEWHTHLGKAGEPQLTVAIER
jgi:hypothetical protein